MTQITADFGNGIKGLFFSGRRNVAELESALPKVEKKPEEIEWCLTEGRVYIKGDQLIVCGCPPDEDYSSDEECVHNCDDMGCTSIEHVLLRATVTHTHRGPHLQKVEEY